MKRVAIIGAGLAGLSAAYDLAGAGVEVIVFEAAGEVGGLAAGFKAPEWDWSLEKFYHHIFQSDAEIIKLVHETGAADLLFFSHAVSGLWDAQAGWYELGGVLPLLRYPRLPFVDRVRMGAVGAWLKVLKLVNRWQHLEKQTTEAYLKRTMGPRVYRQIWQPVLEGKFGPYASEINAAWFWARIATRTFKLGYFRGGFQAFANKLAACVEQRGASIRLHTPVQQLQQTEQGWNVIAEAGVESVDYVISTTSPSLLRRMAPQLPSDYTSNLEQLHSLGAVVLTVALNQSLTKGMYWMNMDKQYFPFLALVEHTQLIDRSHYAGQHLVYLGDYLLPSHEYFRLSAEELLERFLPSLTLVNKNFERSWIEGYWLHREAYAQPVVPVNHSRAIPPLATPLAGLWWASMSQVYPWDRGTNFAVEIGRKVAREVLTQLPQALPKVVKS